MLETLALLICMFLPQPLKRYFLSKVAGYEIPKTCRIGISYIRVSSLKIGENSKIGHFNFIRNLDRLELGDYASIGHLNWVTGVSEAGAKKHFLDDEGRVSNLILGQHSAVVHRNIIDCTNSITIGEYTTLAGFRSQLLTHGIDIMLNKQSSAPISIGDYCLIGTRCIIIKGASLPSYSSLGAGSLLNKGFDEEFGLYGGVPARKIKTLPLDAAYFHRKTGRVD